MPVDIDSPDYFLIGQDNYSPEAYQKNGDCQIGGYDRDAYCWEVLFRPNLSGVTAGADITSVTIDVSLTSGGAGGPFTLAAHDQDKGSWTDSDPEPAWSENPNNDSTDSWPTALSSVSAARNGVRTIPTSSNLVDWFQDVLDGIETNDGLILSWYTEYFAWFGFVDDVTVNITYTPPRKVMVVS